MDRYLIIDDTTGKRKRGPAVAGGGGYLDEDFDVTAPGGQTTFQLANDITGSQTIDVFRNGQMMREGATYDFQRDDTLNQIIFNSSVPQNAWVRVRLY